VIVGAEAIFSTEFSDISHCGHLVGRLSVDVDVKPTVDLLGNLIQRDHHTNPGFSVTGSDGASVSPRRRTVSTKSESTRTLASSAFPCVEHHLSASEQRDGFA
jgi:hypothetical protein